MGSVTVIDLSQDDDDDDDDDNNVVLDRTLHNRGSTDHTVHDLGSSVTDDNDDSGSIGYASDEAVTQGYCPERARRARRDARRRSIISRQTRPRVTTTVSPPQQPQQPRPHPREDEQQNQVTPSPRHETVPTQQPRQQTTMAAALPSTQQASSGRTSRLQLGPATTHGPQRPVVATAESRRQRQHQLRRNHRAALISLRERTLALREERRQRRDGGSAVEEADTMHAIQSVECPTLGELVHDREVLDDGGPVCIICQTNMPLCVALPCLHMSYCVSCARSMCCDEHGQPKRVVVHCAKCRRPARAVSRVFAE